MNKVRAGVIGVGRMGTYHVGILSELDKVELSAVVDIDSKSRQIIEKNYETQGFDNYRDIYDKVDIAVVAVPTGMHYPIAKDLLNAGIHVLLEKPCANTLDHARELFQIAEDKNLTLHIGHVERFNGAVQELHKIVESPIFVEADSRVVVSAVSIFIEIIFSLIVLSSFSAINSCSSLISPIATLAPAFKNAFAIPKPIPLAPPVINAVFLLKCFIRAQIPCFYLLNRSLFAFLNQGYLEHEPFHLSQPQYR